MNRTRPLLEAADLTIGYRPGGSRVNTVAGPLYLEMFPGQLICLLGPNGAGKSTLIRTLAGLQPLLGGSVKIEGESIATLKPGQLARKLSLVLTGRVRSGNLNVYSLVALGRYPYTGWLGNLSQADKKIIGWALEATHAVSLADRKTDQLSDGECQKVMLARALAQDTPLIILDEPTAHLDLPNRVELMRLLRRLARQTNKAILLSTHELDLALQAADRAWLLSAGGQLTAGVPEDLVLGGTIEAAFDKAGVQFDKKTGTFNLYREPDGPIVRLIGEGAPAFWTRRALQREGYAVSQGDQPAGYTIEITQPPSSRQWIIKDQESCHDYTTIADLLQALKVLSATTYPKTEPLPNQ